MLYTNSNGEPTGLISNVQKYTIHDGPGIRTEMFFVGCPLNCLWCSNPETVSPGQKLGVYPAKCIGFDKCGLCQKVCPSAELPLRFSASGTIDSVAVSTDCADCFKCAEVCPPRAIKVWGEHYTVPQLMEIILQDLSFYKRSGGGVTLSGGEVMLQWEFAAMLLDECRQKSIDTCVETAMHCPWEHANHVFERTDLIITDIKHMSSDKHREFTGAGNEIILKNIANSAQIGIPMIIRTPVVPGYNGDDDALRSIAEYIKTLPDNVILWQLLPYRKLGTEKYDSLGKAYPLGDYVPPERSEWEANLLRLQRILAEDYGLPVAAGSGGKIVLP